jgi:hypothetical protein
MIGEMYLDKFHTSESEERECLRGLQTEALHTPGSDVSVMIADLQLHSVECGYLIYRVCS